jgi:hypothetical protein
MFVFGGRGKSSLGVGNINPSNVSNIRHQCAGSSDGTQTQTQK